MRTRLGFSMRARPISTMRRWPPDRLPACSLARSRTQGHHLLHHRHALLEQRTIPPNGIAAQQDIFVHGHLREERSILRDLSNAGSQDRARRLPR